MNTACLQKFTFEKHTNAGDGASHDSHGRALKLPERDEDHHFDAKEFAHWFDWTQFLSQSPVEQHQAVHGKLGRKRKLSVIPLLR